MTWTLALDTFTHDLRIDGGAFRRVLGSDEIRQRVKVALWHYFSEYFLNTPDGTPWHEDIMGRTVEASAVDSILRQRILSVPGVLRINALRLDYNEETRIFSPEIDIDVQSGPGETSTITFSTSFPVEGQ